MLPALVASADERARLRFLELIAVAIRNSHTRRAYAQAADEFLGWCAARGVASIAAAQPLHVAAWIEMMGREVSAPTVKQRLVAMVARFLIRPRDILHFVPSRDEGGEAVYTELDPFPRVFLPSSKTLGEAGHYPF